jgi:xanthine dehydrogenase molybdopterin-binding subunit B
VRVTTARQCFFLADRDELRHDKTGRLLTTDTTTYKILSITDLPQEFHVNFIDKPKHQLNVRRSKADVEPPLLLGLTVWLAAQHALEFVGNMAKSKWPYHPAAKRFSMYSPTVFGKINRNQTVGLNFLRANRRMAE